MHALAIELGLAEVLGLLTDDTEMEDERRIYIGRAVLNMHDASSRRSYWRVPFKKFGIFKIRLTDSGASVTNSQDKTEVRYSHTQLNEYRKAHSRNYEGVVADLPS
jgi:hypothetical protein